METSQNNKPPNLIQGILLATLGTCISLLLISWFIINYQVEQLVKARTSEYAHSIARVAADSSAEALLSGDLLQLNLLVKNVAKDPYIRQATIYSEDGQVVTQFPKEILQATPKENDPAEKMIASDQQLSGDPIEQYKSDFLERQKNIPFIEKIAYQGVTGGWFKLEINSSSLEKDFRAAFKQIQLLMASMATLFFVFLVIFVARKRKNIDRLSRYCQRLLLQHNRQPSAKLSEWMTSIKHLTEDKAQELKEHIQLPQQKTQWVQGQLKKEILICYLEFEIADPKFTNIAQQLTIAESYLLQAAQSFGVQSQGDILTGCWVPFLESYEGDTADEDRLKDALSFITLVSNLFKELELPIEIKSILAHGNLLVLEDQRELVTGIFPTNPVKEKINRLAFQIAFGDTIFIDIPQAIIKPLAKITPVSTESTSAHLSSSEKKTDTEKASEAECYCKLVSVKAKIKQQIARKQRYILDSNQ